MLSSLYHFICRLKQKYLYYFDIVINIFGKYELNYVVESLYWSIGEDGKHLTSNIKGMTSRVLCNPTGLKNSIIHFGSINVLYSCKSLERLARDNVIIATWFHVDSEDKKKEGKLALDKYVDKWHTSCDITKKQMVELGISEDKIIVIPLGIDLNVFKPVGSAEEKNSLKKRLGIPNDKLLMGSFQKDGCGWGDGNEPKPVKGPDIYCDVVEQLSKKHDLFVVLTGPARGYVMNRLEKIGVPYIHKYFSNPNDVSIFYKVLDLYLVSSRAEGGPKSVLESLASGVPIVSTRVGMAPELISNGVNGFITDIDDKDSIVANIEKLFDSKELAGSFVENGLNVVKNYTWKSVAGEYEKQIYSSFKLKKQE